MTERSSLLHCDEEAAHWYARRHSRTMTPDENAAFEAWKCATPNNAAAWDAVEAADRASARLADMPEFAALRAAALRPRRGILSSRKWQMAASLALLVTAGGVSYSLLQDRTSAPGVTSAQPRLYETAVGEMRTFTLADGSRMTLNTNSAVSIAAWKDTRRIQLLRGEGYFTVAKDAKHPFIVDAGSGNVQAVGTAFSVHKLPQGFRVALAEGKVKIDMPSQQSAMLSPGQQLSYDGKAVQIAATGALDATKWLSGELIFKDIALADAIAEVNRYSRQQIKLTGTNAGSRKLSGVFRTGDTATFVQAITAYGMARIQSENAQEIRVSGL